MKRTITFLAAVVAGFLTLTASAQYDMFGAPRTIILAKPTVLVNGGVATTTNLPIDTHGFVGIAKVDVVTATNDGSGSLTFTLETSPDRTNWVSLSNFAIASAYINIVTNFYHGATNCYGTNVINLPGVVTSPTASSSGFATTYIAPNGFTNTGAVTIVSNGVITVGYNVEDADRYLHIVWTPTGTSSNDTVSAIFTGRRSQ